MTLYSGPVMTDMHLDAPDDVKQITSRWNPLTPLVPVQESDSEKRLKGIGQRFGGRTAYADEIAGLVTSICNPGFRLSNGAVI